ncbi:MAG TPA: hypothetical protein VNY05_29450 [Candidatus Acidoferrales bacterium]|jgi:hypothetical protein|nr:hypothetical protein [Candidatus Acidoferrales bacterium]
MLAVFRAFLPGKPRLAPTTNYNFRGGQDELLLILDEFSDREIEAVRRGAAEFALLVHRGIIFLLYRFGDAIPWSDCPYSIWLIKPEEQTAPQNEGPSKPGRSLLSSL